MVGIRLRIDHLCTHRFRGHMLSGDAHISETENYPYFSIFLRAAVWTDSIWEDQVHGPADSVEIYHSRNSSPKHFSCSPRFVLLCYSSAASSFIPSSASSPLPLLLFLSSSSFSTSSSQQVTTVSDSLSSQAMPCSFFTFILVSLYTLYISPPSPPPPPLPLSSLVWCSGEFWLGNDHIHLLTKAKDMVLRIELEDFEGVREYAKFDQFYVANEFLRYRLSVSGYRCVISCSTV